MASGNKYAYLAGECPAPSPDITSAVSLISGKAETGNLCFPIETTGANKLMLQATDEVNIPNAEIAETLWFALHK